MLLLLKWFALFAALVGMLLVLVPSLFFGVQMVWALWCAMFKDLEEYRERHRKVGGRGSGDRQSEHDSDEKPPVS